MDFPYRLYNWPRDVDDSLRLYLTQVLFVCKPQALHGKLRCSDLRWHWARAPSARVHGARARATLRSQHSPCAPRPRARCAPRLPHVVPSANARARPHCVYTHMRARAPAAHPLPPHDLPSRHPPTPTAQRTPSASPPRTPGAGPVRPTVRPLGTRARAPCAQPRRTRARARRAHGLCQNARPRTVRAPSASTRARFPCICKKKGAVCARAPLRTRLPAHPAHALCKHARAHALYTNTRLRTPIMRRSLYRRVRAHPHRAHTNARARPHRARTLSPPSTPHSSQLPHTPPHSGHAHIQAQARTHPPILRSQHSPCAPRACTVRTPFATCAPLCECARAPSLPVPGTLSPPPPLQPPHPNPHRPPHPLRTPSANVCARTVPSPCALTRARTLRTTSAKALTRSPCAHPLRAPRALRTPSASTRARSPCARERERAHRAPLRTRLRAHPAPLAP